MSDLQLLRSVKKDVRAQVEQWKARRVISEAFVTTIANALFHLTSNLVDEYHRIELIEKTLEEYESRVLEEAKNVPKDKS